MGAKDYEIIEDDGAYRVLKHEEGGRSWRMTERIDHDEAIAFVVALKDLDRRKGTKPSIDSVVAGGLPGLIARVGDIVTSSSSMREAVRQGDGEVYEEHKAVFESSVSQMDFDALLVTLTIMDQLSQPLPTLVRGAEVQQLMALDGRPLRVSAEFLAMLYETSNTAFNLRLLPAGTYYLRKKYDHEDSWDIRIENHECESCFSLPIHEAVSALLRDAKRNPTT